MARRKRRVHFRFFVFMFILVAGIVGAILLLTSRRGTATIDYGDVTAIMTGNGAIIRDETTVSTESYQKINFEITEGTAIANGTMIATVFKRGYQEESMVGKLRAEREIYAKQLSLLPEEQQYVLQDMNERIHTVEQQIRDTARGDSTLDMLSLENTLRQLQRERSTYLRSAVMPDAELNALYAELDNQQNVQNNWTRSIVNSAGSGIISFYFDGYETVLNAAGLGTINDALINKAVKGGNTKLSSDAMMETPLYRLVSNTHWYMAFVTNGTSPVRTVAGQVYNVRFDDYSDQIYLATALEPIVTKTSVVNILEFNTDIGDFLSIRSVKFTIQKGANGTTVPVKMLGYASGVPYVLVRSGTKLVQVKVQILAADEDIAVVKAINDSQTLTKGWKIQQPEEEEDDD